MLRTLTLAEDKLCSQCLPHRHSLDELEKRGHGTIREAQAAHKLKTKPTSRDAGNANSKSEDASSEDEDASSEEEDTSSEEEDAGSEDEDVGSEEEDAS